MSSATPRRHRHPGPDPADSLTERVLQAMAGTADPRVRAIMAAIVRHAHALVRELQPTPEEYEQALRFLVDLGHHTTAAKNEVVLFADVIGVSALVDQVNRTGVESETALLGPFYRGAAPWCAAGDSIARSEAPGPTLMVAGQVRNAEGGAIAGAVLDVWQASPVGLYENQDQGQADMNLRGRFRADGEGRYRFRTVRPARYPVPTDGPVGVLLSAQRRHPYRPAHLHFIVSAEGHRTLVTQVFTDAEAELASDVVFSATPGLMGGLHRHDRPDPAHPGAAPPFFSLEYDFVLAKGTPTFPVPPIP
ncbi:MAG: catechol 1,2-dioxygenase [Proteobacteria bacterium]|nr:catechol 1,2-dioxygenase [Pseudomonadota bacterium]MBI3497744.1 catechol 1,2-dioxygenase [Pseudomonadota bacterium]